MNTAITCEAAKTAKGWVLYDGECPLCTGAALRFQNLLRRNGFNLATLQTPWVCEQFNFQPGAAPDEMIVLLPDGRSFGGADGIVQIARRIWWARPLFALAQIPGVRIVVRAVYRQIAANRNCSNGICSIPKPPRGRHAVFFELP